MTKPEDQEDAFRKFVLENFRACSVAEALSERDVKDVMASFLGKKKKDVSNAMREKGFVLGGNDGKGKRYVRYIFEEEGSPSQPVGKKERLTK